MARTPKPAKVAKPPKAKRQKGAPHAKPTVKDKVLDRAAAKLFPPSAQGAAADAELRDMTGGES